MAKPAAVTAEGGSLGSTLSSLAEPSPGGSPRSHATMGSSEDASCGVIAWGGETRALVRRRVRHERGVHERVEDGRWDVVDAVEPLS